MKGPYKCDNNTFGDPYSGAPKQCQCKEMKKDGEDWDSEDEDDAPYDQAIEMDTPVGEMSVEWDDGYYEGAVYMDDEEYAYNFRRSNAVRLGGASAIAVISALFA